MGAFECYRQHLSGVLNGKRSFKATRPGEQEKVKRELVKKNGQIIAAP